MKLGKNEVNFLYELGISSSELFLGYLLSGRSVSRAYRIAHQLHRDRDRKGSASFNKQKRQQRKQMIKKLEQKNLIRLVPKGVDSVVRPTKLGQEFIEIQKMRRTMSAGKGLWDGNWTLVMFDIPTGEDSRRYRLSLILKEIGFIQVQLSNYIYPYPTPELEKFLAQNKSYGEFCHIFRGKYTGDDSGLRKKFKLVPKK